MIEEHPLRASADGGMLDGVKGMPRPHHLHAASRLQARRAVAIDGITPGPDVVRVHDHHPHALERLQALHVHLRHTPAATQPHQAGVTALPCVYHGNRHGCGTLPESQEVSVSVQLAAQHHIRLTYMSTHTYESQPLLSQHLSLVDCISASVSVTAALATTSVHSLTRALPQCEDQCGEGRQLEQCGLSGRVQRRHMHVHLQPASTDGSSYCSSYCQISG